MIEAIEILRDVLESGNPKYLQEFNTLEEAVKADGSADALRAYRACLEYPEFSSIRDDAKRAQDWSGVSNRLMAQQSAERKLAARAGFGL